MSTTTYPFGGDHDDRDVARMRADLSGQLVDGAGRPRRLGSMLRRLTRSDLHG